MTAEALCEAIRRAGHPDAVHISGVDAIVDHLAGVARAPDVILTQGAGNIWKVGEAFMKRISEDALVKKS